VIAKAVDTDILTSREASLSQSLLYWTLAPSLNM